MSMESSALANASASRSAMAFTTAPFRPRNTPPFRCADRACASPRARHRDRRWRPAGREDRNSALFRK
jgi:hypothetical protein